MLTGLARLTEAHWRLRRVLFASAKVELQKRYAGSIRISTCPATLKFLPNFPRR